MFDAELLKELEGISEDTIMKMKLMAEEKIQESVAAKEAELNEAHEAELVALADKANDYAEYVVAEMSDKIDAYTTYVVETFISENKTKLVESKEYDRMKVAFEKMKSVFEEGFFKVSGDAAYDELNTELTEAKSEWMAAVELAQDLKKQNLEMQQTIVFEGLTKELAETQREKVAEIVENMNFETIGDFTRGVKLMVEQSKKKVTEEDDEDEDDEDDKEDSDKKDDKKEDKKVNEEAVRMNSYLKHL